MDFLNRMIKVIDYLESHLTDRLDLQDLSNIICCNPYQFGRIFSYVTGIPLAEYVRKRRLSLAAAELAHGTSKVLDTAYKYGYSSPEAFARAFKEMHGISPREAAVFGAELKMYPRLAFQITIKGVESMEYKIVERDVIRGVGVTRKFGRFEPNRQLDDWKDQMGEVWLFWEEFLNEGANLILRDKYKLYREPFWQMGVSSTDSEGNLTVSIGAEDSGGNYPELTRFEIPASTWAVFSTQGSLNGGSHPVDALLTKIFSEWLPSSGYEQSMNYQIEVYGPGDTGRDDYQIELWIPVRLKQRRL